MTIQKQTIIRRNRMPGILVHFHVKINQDDYLSTVMFCKITFDMPCLYSG